MPISDMYQLQLGCSEFCKNYPFEMFITLTYKFSPTRMNMEKNLKKYIQVMSNKTGLRLGVVAVIVTQKHRPHIHLLAFGVNKKGETLSDKPTSLFECAWRYGSADCQHVYDLEGIAKYLSNNFHHTSSLWTYGHKLLNSHNLYLKAA